MESNIWCSSGSELTVLATIFSIYISQYYDAYDLVTISAFLEIVSNILAIIATQNERCENSHDSSNFLYKSN